MDVTYIGRSHYRTVSAEDLAGKGIVGFETTTWSRGGTETVQAAGGQWLVDNASAEFIEASPTAPLTLSATSSTAKPTSSTSSTSKSSSTS